MLFFLVVMRMSGFIFLNPILGRRDIPAMVKSGLVMSLSVMVYSMEQAQGTQVPDALSAFQFGILLMKEFAIGYVLGFTMQLFDMIMVYAGAVIDFQLGISMATVYDPQTGNQVALTGNIFQIYYLLLFFAVDGHVALMKILITAGDIVPYGQVTLGQEAAQAVLTLFAECVVLAVKLSFPLIAFEFVVEVGMGFLMKVSPQVNLFVASIQIRLIVGLVLLIFLISPIGEQLGTFIRTMINTLVQMLHIVSG